MSEPELVLEESSFNSLISRNRSRAFKGLFTPGQAVIARCGDKTQAATIVRASKLSWVAKKRN